jgi:hypothetical protein
MVTSLRVRTPTPVQPRWLQRLGAHISGDVDTHPVGRRIECQWSSDQTRRRWQPG